MRNQYHFKWISIERYCKSEARSFGSLLEFKRVNFMTCVIGDLWHQGFKLLSSSTRMIVKFSMLIRV